MKRTYLLAASCAVLLAAAPSFAICSIDNGNDAGDAGKPLVDCWIYPEDGGEGKVVKLKEGAKAPKGYAFQPAPPKTEAEILDEEGIEATQLEQANARIAELEAAGSGDADAARETVKIQETQIKKLQSDVEALTAEKALFAESAQALQDKNDGLKAAAKAAETTTKKPAAKTAKTVKESSTDKGGDAAGSTDANDGDGQQ